MGTRCQTKRESACLTCGFLDNIHLLLAWYRAISACQLNHVLLRSFRHFLITVSETDSNEISSNFNFPLPFQINLKLLFFLVMFQKNCLFLQVGTCNPAQLPPPPHKTSPAGGSPSNQSHKDIFLKSLLPLVRPGAISAQQNAGNRGFCSGSLLGSGELPTWALPQLSSLLLLKGHSLCSIWQWPMVLLAKPTFSLVSSLNHVIQKTQEA